MLKLTVRSTESGKSLYIRAKNKLEQENLSKELEVLVSNSAYINDKQRIIEIIANFFTLDFK